MAPRMKLWIGLVIAGCAGAWLMVPGLMPEGPWGSPRGGALLEPETETRLEAVAVASAAQRLRWLDSIGARWEEASRHGLVLGLDEPNGADELRDSVRAMLATVADGRARVGYAAVRADWLLPESRHVKRRPPSSRPIHLLDPATGRCAVVQAEVGGDLRRAARRLRREGPGLGPCAWVARYGPPGDSIAAWLGRGGSGFAVRTTEVGEKIQVRGTNRLSGFPAYPEPNLEVSEERCVYGDDDACVAMLAAPGSPMARLRPRAEGDPAISSVLARPALGGVGADLLAELEGEVGPERFVTFWRSDRAVTAALAEATGRPAERWVGEWVRARVEGPALRAGLRPLDLLITLAILAVLGAVAVVVAGRRRAG